MHSQPSVLWRAPTSPCSLSRPTLDQNTICIGTCTGQFYALNKLSGRIIWSHDGHQENAATSFEASPLLIGGLIVAGTSHSCFGNARGRVYAFDKKTGTIRWALPIGVGSSNFVTPDEADPNASVVFESEDGEWVSTQVYTGKVNWKFPATSGGSDCASKGYLVTDGVHVCFLARDHLLHCLDGKSGHELWKREPDARPTTGLLMYKDVLYYGSADKYIRGLDPENGKVLVQLRAPHEPTGSIAESYGAAEGDLLFAYGSSENGNSDAVMTFADEFERTLWSQRSSVSWSSTQPLPYRKWVIGGDCDGELLAFGIGDGRPQWKTQVTGCITSITHDASTIYVSVKDGRLYVFAPTVR